MNRFQIYSGGGFNGTIYGLDLGVRVREKSIKDG